MGPNLLFCLLYRPTLMFMMTVGLQMFPTQLHKTHTQDSHQRRESATGFWT